MNPLETLRTARPSAFLPDSLLTWGTVSVVGDPVLVAGERGTLTAELTLTAPLSAGHSVEVWTHFVSDLERLQGDHPEQPASFVVEAFLAGRPLARQDDEPFVECFAWPDAKVHGPHTFFPYRRYAGFHLRQDAPAGTRFVVCLRQVTMQTYEEPLFNLRFAILRDTHTLVGYLGDACYTVVGGPPHALRVVAPTCVALDEPFDCAIVVCDRWRNKTGAPLEAMDFAALVEARAGASLQGLNGAQLVYDAERRLHLLKGTTCTASGTFYLTLAVRGAPQITGTSNPIVARERWDERVYWGDLHQHSYHDDGRGTPAGNYRYARDTSLLDFCAVTPHQEYLLAPALYRLPGPLQRGWEELIEAAEAANGPELVTFLGSEASALNRLAGHMNAYYLETGNRPEFERLGWDPTISPVPDIESYQHYLAVLEQSQGEVLLLPHAHAGGGPGKFDLPPRPDYQTNVEICSSHGVFEEFYWQWLRHGYHVGVNGGGDNHMTSTGNGNGGFHYPNTNGLGAVSAEERSRFAIWQGIRRRRTYAVTSNQRLFLDFSLNGAPMGAIIPSRAAAGARRYTAHVEIAGTAPLLKVELFRGEEVIHIYHPSVDAHRYLRLVWTDSFGSRRVDDSLTTGTISLTPGHPKLLRGINQFTRSDQFTSDGDLIRFRSNAYSGITRGALLEVPSEAQALTMSIHDRHLSDILLDERIKIPLSQARATISRPLQVDPELPRWRQFGPQAQLPAFTLDMDWVDPTWPRTMSLDWEVGPEKSGAYYLVRVEQLDGALAWSSPIWLE